MQASLEHVRLFIAKLASQDPRAATTSPQYMPAEC